MRPLGRTTFAALVALVALAAAARPASAAWNGPTQFSLVAPQYIHVSKAVGAADGSRLIVRNVGDPGGGEKIVGNWVSATGLLGPEVDLSAVTPDGTKVTSVTAAGNADGDICVAWSEEGPDPSYLAFQKVRVVRANHTLGQVVSLGGAAATYFDGPAKVAVDDSARCAVGWSQTKPTLDGWVVKRRVVTATSAGTPVTIATSNSDGSATPALGPIAISPNGFVAQSIGTVNYDGGIYEFSVAVHRYSTLAGPGFTTPLGSFATSGGGLTMPAVSRDRFGRTLAAWPEPDDESILTWKLRTARVSAIGFVQQLGVVAGFASNAPEVRLATDANGHGALAWSTFTGGNGWYGSAAEYEVRAKRVDSDGSFGSVSTVFPADPASITFSGFDQAVDQDGNAYFVASSAVLGVNNPRPTMLTNRLTFSSGSLTDPGALTLPNDGYVTDQSITASTCGKAMATMSLVGPPADDPMGSATEGTHYFARTDGGVAC